MAGETDEEMITDGICSLFAICGITPAELKAVVLRKEAALQAEKTASGVWKKRGK